METNPLEDFKSADKNKADAASIELSSTFEAMCYLIMNYDPNWQPETKKRFNKLLSQWIMSNYADMEGEIIGKINEILRESSNGFATPDSAEPKACFAVQAMVIHQNFEPLEYFMNQDYFSQFADNFCKLFIKPLPNLYENHIAAKAQFNQNYGASFIEKLSNTLNEEPAFRALISMCKWYPVDWYPQLQESLNAYIVQKSPYPVLIYAEVIKQNPELLDFDTLNSLVTYFEPAQDTTQIPKIRSLMDAQSYLFKCAAIIFLAHINEDSAETASTLFQFAEYFFDEEKTPYCSYQVTDNVVAVLYRITSVCSTFNENISSFILNRIIILLTPQEEETQLIIPEAEIGQLATLFASIYSSDVSKGQQILSTLFEASEENLLALCALSAMALKIEKLDTAIYFTIFTKFTGYYEEATPIDKENIQVYCYTVPLFGKLINEVDIIPYCQNAFQILLEVFTNQVDWGLPPPTTGSPPKRNYHKEIIIKLITYLARFAKISVDPDIILKCMTEGPQAVKLGATLFNNTEEENQGAILSQISANLSTELMKPFLIFLANIGLIDQGMIEEATQIILYFQEATTSPQLNNFWISAFKCISMRSVFEFLPNIYQRIGNSAQSAQAFFDLLYSGICSAEIAQQLNPEWLLEHAQMVKDVIMTSITNTKHYETQSDSFRKAVLPMITQILNLIKKFKASFQSLNLAEEIIALLYSILNDRCSSPILYGKIINAIKELQTIDDRDQEQVAGSAVSISNASWNFLYSPEYEPNERSWIDHNSNVINQIVTSICSYYDTIDRNRTLSEAARQEQLAEFIDSAIMPGMKFIPSRSPEFYELFKSQLIEAASKKSGASGTSVQKDKLLKEGIPILACDIDKYRFDE